MQNFAPTGYRYGVRGPLLSFAAFCSVGFVARLNAACDGPEENVEKKEKQSSASVRQQFPFRGKYCHLCINKGYNDSFDGSTERNPSQWSLFMGASVCGFEWRKWRGAGGREFSAKEVFGGGLSLQDDVKGQSVEAYKALQACVSDQSEYYDSVHWGEIEEAVDLPEGPMEEEGEDWEDLKGMVDEDTQCGLCIFMRGSPCANHFRR